MLVTRLFELLFEEFGVKDFHTFSVSYKRQGVKLEREEGCIPDLGWMLSEAGFAGFGGIFGIAGERLMVGQRDLFCGGGAERAGCGGAIIGDAPMYTSLAPSWH